MSFRLKTIIGIALIEGSLLLILVWSSVNYLQESSQQELTLRAKSSAESLANLTRDAVLATDLARLDSVTRSTLESPEIAYVRIMDNAQVLSQAGGEEVLARPFVQDMHLSNAHDGVFDVGVDLVEGGYTYGRVELGVSVARANEVIAEARRHLSGIAVAEMVLVALFSALLGAYLTRGLNALAQASRAISDGELGTCVEVKGGDELAETGRAFNEMSVRLAESRRAMELTVADSISLASRLAENEQRLATILDTAVDGFVTIDQQGIIDDINAAGAELFGYGEDELVGRNVSCLMPEPDRSAHDGYLRRYLDHGGARIIGRGRRVVGLRKDGSTFPMDLAVSEMTIGDRHMFVGLVRDLTEQLNIEAAARKSEAMRAAIIDANLNALVTIDAEDRIVEFSTVAEQMFGYRREAAIGQNMAELLIPPKMRQMHLDGMKKYLATGEGPVIGKRLEVQALRADGETFPVELTVQPIDVDGEMFFSALLRDISDRKAEEQALLDAKQRAEVASEAKSRFLAHMSHEIRSPLNAVLGSLDLLQDDGLSKDQRLYAETAKASGRILLALINDILDFSRIEAGRVTLDSSDFAVRELIEETMNLVAFKARDKGLYAAALVDVGVASWVRGDATRLRQILGNLLDNALKFTDSGAVVLTVEQRAAGPDGVELRFTVEDSGIGIPQAVQAGLFDEFQQVDSSDSTRHGGSGLGLSICQGLAALMGGTIGLHSEPGRGSRFWLDISLAPAQPALEPAGQADAMPLKRVLAVGFDQRLTALLRKMLVGAVGDLVCADDVRQAAPMLSAGVQAVLADSQLPTDGLEALARQARALGVQRVLLLAPTATPQTVQWVASGQFDDLVLSPLLMHHLADSLRATRDQHSVSAAERHPAEAAQVGVPTATRILLAEDSVANQLVATALLRRQGYAVDVANNGREAVEMFAAGGHDLILMDLRMPRMDGLGATEEIRALPGGAQVPIIAMTANALQQDVDRCLAAGMDDFVPKPVDKAHLLETLARHLPAVSSGGGVRRVAGATPYSDDPLIDENVIRQLNNDVTEEAVPAMLIMFVDETTARAEKLLKALNDSALDALEDEAHTLKSCAGTFGAARLQALARDIEAACREGNRQSAENLGKGMGELLRQTLAAYRKRFDFLADTKGEG